MTSQIITNWGNTTLEFFSSGLEDLGFQMKTGLSPEPSSDIVSAQHNATIVAPFKSLFLALNALTPASVHSLWNSPKFSNQLFLIILSRLCSSLSLVHIFLLHFSFPVNWYSSVQPLQTTSLFSNGLLCRTLPAEGVGDSSPRLQLCVLN